MSAAFRAICNPGKLRVFTGGGPRYDNLEVIKSSSSVTTVLIVGAGLEQIEVDDFILAFGTLTSNMSSQPDFNSNVKCRLFEVLRNFFYQIEI